MPRLDAKSVLSSAWKSGWLVHSVRTALGMTASLGVARMVGLPEAFWAPITTVIVMESAVGPAWVVSKRRFLGTAMGAAFAASLRTYLGPGVIAFGAAILALGLICFILRLHRASHRFACIALSIVILVPRGTAAWIVAFHRFVEVSLGIAVALVFAALWPVQEPQSL